MSFLFHKKTEYLQSEEFKSQYPFESKFFDLGSCKMHYIDEGQGDVLFFVHACPMWSFSFRNLIREFSKEYRVIAIDQIGFGLSDKPENYDYRIESHIENLERFIMSLGLKNITFVLHGRGAPIGAAYAVRYPEDIKSLILFNSMALSDFRLPFRLQFCRFHWLGARFIQTINVFKWDTMWLPAAVRRGYNYPIRNREGQLPLLRFIEDIPCAPEDDSAQSMFEIESALWMLRMKPVIILWGKRDWLYSRFCFRKWVSYFPKAEVHLLGKGGRYLMEDSLSELCIHMRNFLSKQNHIAEEKTAENAE